MNYQEVSKNIEDELVELFKELRKGISSREDSRAFGAMIEKKITENWVKLCDQLGYSSIVNPGRRTIYDFACTVNGKLLGFDVKTKDLDSTKYSDGGVCAVGNLLKFLANDKGVFMIVEFGHGNSEDSTDTRDITYIKVAPFHCLPADNYRIENLGTGQVRLNYTLHEIWEKIDWQRTYEQFFDIFTELSIIHYKRVQGDAEKRVQSIESFQKRGYNNFKFN
jgi:hypothetical protein